MFALFFSVFFGVAAQATTIDCLDGYWDFGPQIAVLEFQCLDHNQAVIRFCNRNKLLKKGLCFSPDSIPCTWDDGQWSCREDDYTSKIFRLSPTTIRYQFKSNFNEGTLDGELL